jgi:hypothetical protein
MRSRGCRESVLKSALFIGRVGLGASGAQVDGLRVCGKLIPPRDAIGERYATDRESVPILGSMRGRDYHATARRRLSRITLFP